MGNQDLEKIVRRFIRQPEPDMCETTSMKNILDELARRHKVRKLRISLKKLNEFYDYRRGVGTDSVVGISRLGDNLGKSGYRIRKEYGPSSNLELLDDIVRDENSSFPVISVHPEYFFEQNIRYQVKDKTKMEHVLVILAVGNDVTFYDPYERFLLKSTRVLSVRNTLYRARILHHWERTKEPRWVVWVERLTPRLEHFGVDADGED